MTKRIYVGNLPFSAREDEVYDLFTPFGEIESLAMINDRDTGRFRGFCFVEMPDADAEAAIEALDGHDFNGRSLRVNEARPRENRGGGGGRRGGGGGGYGGNRGGGGGYGGNRGGGGGYGGNRGGGGGYGNRRDDYGGGSRW